MGDAELQTFSDRLKELRNDLKMTQKDFAENIGITASALSAYEKNLKNPSIGVVKRIAKEYHVSIDWLCGLNDEQNPDSEIKTYSDIIRLLAKITTCEKAEYLYTDIGVYENSVGNQYGFINFRNDDMINFIADWSKLYDLLRNGSIDNDLYQMWIEKALKEYDRPIESGLPF